MESHIRIQTHPEFESYANDVINMQYVFPTDERKMCMLQI